MLSTQRRARHIAPCSTSRSINARLSDGHVTAFLPKRVQALTLHVPSRFREVNFLAPAE